VFPVGVPTIIIEFPEVVLNAKPAGKEPE